jgi:internalin A
MHEQRRIPLCLATLALLAACGLGVLAAAEVDRKSAPKPLPPEIDNAWRDAGARVGWMIDTPPQTAGGYEYWHPFREKVEIEAILAFRLLREQEDVLATLPDPGVAFGLDLHCWSGDVAECKKFARLTSLHSLNIGGSLLLTDAGMKELAALRNLRAVYLFYAHVTDAGLKDLAENRLLQVLDISNTQVTDAGLKELAPLKNLEALNLAGTRVTDAGLKDLSALFSLRWLNLNRTAVTADGAAALQRDLPRCKITFRDE